MKSRRIPGIVSSITVSGAAATIAFSIHIFYTAGLSFASDTAAEPVANSVTPSNFYPWLFENFPGMSVSPDDDPGNFGIPLLARYFFGLDPHLPQTSGFQETKMVELEGVQHLAFRFRQRSQHDVTAVFESSADLVNWQPMDEQVIEIETEGNLQWVTVADLTPIGSDEKRFMRITLIPPSHPGEAEMPFDVSVIRLSRLRAEVDWETVDVDSYVIQRRTPNSDWMVLATTSDPPFVDDTERTPGTTYQYRVIGRTAGLADSPPTAAVETTVPAIRLTMIGDSNLQRGANENDRVVVKSYVGNGSRPAVDPDDYPDHPSLISGRIMLLRPDIEAVNHGIDGTESGTGLGNTNRANALRVIDGFTRFEAEMLGKGYPWSEDGVERVNAFTPTAADYGYFSFGVNDIHDGHSPEEIRGNFATAIDLWEAEGLSASRFMITTITPRPEGKHQANVPITNNLLRELASARGAILIDTCGLVSNDNGLSWKSSAYHTDGIHFSALTCDLVAAEIISKIPAP